MQALGIASGSDRSIGPPPPGVRESPDAARARSTHNRKVRQRQAERLERWAREKNLVLSAADFESKHLASTALARGQTEVAGQEHDLYFDEATQRWWKRNHIEVMHRSYDEYLHRILLHNELFPAAPLRLEGWLRHDDQLMTVVSQPHVIAERGASPAEIAEHMASLGFIQANGSNVDFVNSETGVIVEDLHQENAVITPEGCLTVIDPVIFCPQTDTEVAALAESSSKH